MNAFIQSAKYGQTPKLREANHLGIVGTVEILEYAINILNYLDGEDQKEDLKGEINSMTGSQRKRDSMASSSSNRRRRRRERMTHFTPPASTSSPPTQDENHENLMKATSTQQSESISKVGTQATVISPLQKES